MSVLRNLAQRQQRQQRRLADSTDIQVTTVSDTQINVIAPDTIECHGTGCTVAVQTTQGTSNTNFTIVISDFCN